MLQETHRRLPARPAVPPGSPPKAGGAASGLTLAEAECLLDWLEARGCTGLRASFRDDGGVTVCWSGAPVPAVGVAALL
jgi:hypothetical protein